jgi:hypothetical protein
MKRVFIISTLLLFSSILILSERHKNRPTEPVTEGCISCHKGVSDPDSSHPISAFGCYRCHLGNPYSFEKERAHVSLVKNPGDLRVVDQTCGKTECHPDMASRVKNSVMATNKGMIKTLQVQWLKGERSKVGVQELMGENPPQNVAIEHFRELCGGCHLWKERGDRPGEVGRRGGGCSDCHILDEVNKGFQKDGRLEHAKITTRIPSRNCVKCHNRSARIGLSYFGKYESPGYGTPYEGGALNSRRLSGNRFFLELPPDIHLKKARMECIDCHTATGVMGDGHPYETMQDQLDITCEGCHIPSFSEVEEGGSLAKRLVSLNGKVPHMEKAPIAFSKKGTPLYNIQTRNGKVFFFRKMDGHSTELDVSSREKPYHTLPGHKQVSCQACHSAWMPQCYGCHLTRRKGIPPGDWITGVKAAGRWREKRSYLRFSSPALGVRKDSTIFPVAPCQVFVSTFDEKGDYQGGSSFKSLNISAFDPHTTSLWSRRCLDCHGDPKTLGLGEGILHYHDGTWTFRATYDAVSSGLGVNFPLDGLVGPGGEAFQKNGSDGTRPFDGGELRRILSVNPCIGCHNRYEDKIYQDFPESKKRFETENGLPCSRE